MITLYAKGLTVEVFDKPVVPPPPPPPPPPVTGLGDIISKPVNMAKTLLMQGWMNDQGAGNPGRYNREEYMCILTGTAAPYKVVTNDFVAGGSSKPFGVATTLTLLFDGKPVATKTVLATDVRVTFAVDTTTLAEGWYMASIGGLDATWSCLDYGVYVMKGATALPQSRMPVVIGSYSLAMQSTFTHQMAWVPSQWTPTVLPLVPRVCPPFSALPKRTNLIFTQVVHGRFGDVYRPVVTKEGVVAAPSKQPYYFSEFQRPKPIMPLCDGPRGKGTLFCPTHLEVGKAAPTAAEGNALGPINNNYFTDPWRVGKVRENGDVVTLCGWRHAGLPQFELDPSNAELVGDWSSIPKARQGFNELWGMAWRIFPIDLTAAPIPAERNLKPHTDGIEIYVSDQRTPMPNGIGRICKLKFSPTSHATPPVVTEFHGDGWNQCFDVVGNAHAPIADADFRLWASDRMGHRIRVLGFDGKVIEDWNNIPQPEGLALFERADGLWLYYTSTVRAGGLETGTIQNFYIRRRHTVTKQDVLIVDVKTIKGGFFIGGNTLLGKIAVNDGVHGTFGPPGMIALATWSNAYSGAPLLFDDSGAFIDWLAMGPSWVDPPFRGQDLPRGMTYTSAPAFGPGRMTFGTACDGLHMVSQALPTDTVWPASVAAGEKEWHDEGYIQTHGHYGMGHYGLPLPWGKSANIDAFLTAHGHINGS